MVEIWIGPSAIDRTAKTDMNPKAALGTKHKDAATKICAQLSVSNVCACLLP